MTVSSAPEWNMKAENLGSPRPTYLDHSQPLEQILELAAAVGEPYPHFHAVLTPERYFLHELLVHISCHASIPHRANLFRHIEDLHQRNITRFSAQCQNERPRIRQQMADTALMADYFLAGKSEQKTELPARLADAYHLWQPYFQEQYDLVTQRNQRGDYVPGQHDKQLSDLSSVFRQLCVNACERQQNQALASDCALGIVKEAINQEELQILPWRSKKERKIHAYAGAIGAGKSYYFYDLLNRVYKDRKGRLPYIFIDLDEWKRLPPLVEQEGDKNQFWDVRAHDECHLIRRRLLDELGRLAQTGNGWAPDVLLHASVLSDRVLDWMNNYASETSVDLFYCEPGKALANGYARYQQGSRVMLTEETLISFQKLAGAVEKYLGRHDWPEKFIVRLRDTTEISAASSSGDGIEQRFDWVFMIQGNRLLVSNVKTLFDVMRGIYINLQAESPDALYLPHTDAQIAEHLRPMLDFPGVGFCTRQRDAVNQYVRRSELGDNYASQSHMTQEGRNYIARHELYFAPIREFLRLPPPDTFPPGFQNRHGEGIEYDDRDLIDRVIAGAILRLPTRLGFTTREIQEQYAQAEPYLRLLSPESFTDRQRHLNYRLEWLSSHRGDEVDMLVSGARCGVRADPRTMQINLLKVNDSLYIP